MRQLRFLILTFVLIGMILGITIGVVASMQGEAQMHSIIIAQATRAMQPVATPSPAPTAYNACMVPAAVPATAHMVVADIDYTQKAVTATQRTTYVNRTSQSLSEVVFNVEANRWQNVFQLADVTTDGNTLLHTLDGKRLEVELPQVLNPGCEIQIMLTFALDIPLIGGDITARKGYFGYTPRQMNLGHWLPVIAPLQGEAWITREAFLIGEQDILEQADWLVTLNLIGDFENVQIAAPGHPEDLGGGRWRYTLPHARDFSLSLSDQFVVLTQDVGNDLRAELYTFPQSQANNAANQALAVAATSLAHYIDLFGPYDYERLLVVEGDFPDGMEFTGMVFVGTNWFNSYANNPAAYLTLITAHEVSHQWWYASIGNDAALHPWLDEALATYSEYIYLEQYYPDLRDWWWTFRVDPFSPQGFVDSTVYEFSDARSYINAVYLRGVRMLHDLRGDMGTDAFFALLRAYADAGRDRIATPDIFWALLTPQQVEMTSGTRARYLRQPVLQSDQTGQ